MILRVRLLLKIVGCIMNVQIMVWSLINITLTKVTACDEGMYTRTDKCEFFFYFLLLNPFMGEINLHILETVPRQAIWTSVYWSLDPFVLTLDGVAPNGKLSELDSLVSALNYYTRVLWSPMEWQCKADWSRSYSVELIAQHNTMRLSSGLSE